MCALSTIYTAQPSPMMTISSRWRPSSYHNVLLILLLYPLIIALGSSFVLTSPHHEHTISYRQFTAIFITSSNRNKESKRNPRTISTSLYHNNLKHDITNRNTSTNRLILPIFPLRKSIRFPTESLTLNLYESRYLSLSESVLSSQKNERFFGALYCSNKPQVVSASGDGVVTPLVEVGDVGVVCRVLDSEDGMVKRRDGGLRRRIKLESLVVGRFRVEGILHNGYGGGRLAAGSGKEAALPFVLVEASRIYDFGSSAVSEEEERDVDKLERVLFKNLMEDETLSDYLFDNLLVGYAMKKNDGQNQADKFSLYEDYFSSMMPPSADCDVNNLNSSSAKSLSNDVNDTVAQALIAWAKGDPSFSIDSFRQQYLSFAVASMLKMDRIDPDDMIGYLECRSTYDRLNRLLGILNEGKGWPMFAKNIVNFFR